MLGKPLQKESLKQLKSAVIAFVLLIPPIIISSQFQHIKLLFHSFLFFNGILLWSYFEYHSHRFWMHDKKLKKVLEPSTKHIYHHSHPTEIRITTKIRLAGIMLEGLLLLIAVMLNNYFTICCGFVAGLIFYFFIHYFLHQPGAVKVVPWLVKNHLFHHIRYPNKCFGISTTLWDRINNTAAPKGSIVSVRLLEIFYNRPRIAVKRHFL